MLSSSKLEPNACSQPRRNRALNADVEQRVSNDRCTVRASTFEGSADSGGAIPR